MTTEQQNLDRQAIADLHYLELLSRLRILRNLYEEVWDKKEEEDSRREIALKLGYVREAIEDLELGLS